MTICNSNRINKLVDKRGSKYTIPMFNYSISWQFIVSFWQQIFQRPFTNLPLNFNIKKPGTKMQPLQKIQWLLTWLCMYPPDKSLCVWQMVARSLFALFILVTNLCCLASCLAYNFKYYSIDINGSIHALTTVVAEACRVYVMSMAILMRRKIANNFEQLSKIYADCKYDKIEFTWFLLLIFPLTRSKTSTYRKI